MLMNMPANINTVNMSISTPVNQRHKHEQYVNSTFANCTYGTERIPYLWTNANDKNELLVRPEALKKISKVHETGQRLST